MQLDTGAEGFIEGERVAKLTTLTQQGIGLVEILVGQLTNSVSLMADGFDSLSDSTVSLMLWLGLRLSKKAPDGRFHYGYLKVESLAALAAAAGMVVVGLTVAYQSYLRLFEPRVLSYPTIALITLLGAGSLALYRALQMRRAAKRYALSSLRVGALNSIKDAGGSFTALAAVFASTAGFPQMDALGGIVIAGYICSVAYASIKESSLVLVDACHRPELVQVFKEIIEKHGVEVEDIRLRRAGPYIVGTIIISADGNLTLNQVGELKRKMKRDLRGEVNGLGEMSIVVHPQGDPSRAGSSW